MKSETRNSKLRSAKESRLRDFYEALFAIWGEQHWWPAHTPFEVIVGAYLTQNTAWTNVERALDRLRSAGVLHVEGIREVPLRRLHSLIRSAGYFRQKAKRLKKFVTFLDERYDGSLENMLARPTAELRQELLALNGIGPETADSILLYAGNHPVFVVDAYTRRILARHRIHSEKAPYDEIRELFEQALLAEVRALPPSPSGQASTTNPGIEAGPRDPARTGASHPPSPMSTAKRSPVAQVYNQMHGLMVGVGKSYCRKSKALCGNCPLERFLPVSKRANRVRIQGPLAAL